MKQLILITACVAAASSAFAQGECVRTAVNLSGNQMTLTTSGAKSTVVRPTYVYYEKKRLRKKDKVYSVPGAQYPSQPILLNSRTDVSPVAEKYNVSVSPAERNITACPDSAVNLAAALNVERVASFTGNYPANSTSPVYRKVSKREYKMAVRKKRKIERKQEKIARRAEVNVVTRSAV